MDPKTSVTNLEKSAAMRNEEDFHGWQSKLQLSARAITRKALLSGAFYCATMIQIILDFKKKS
jgi:hypothetical protein